MNSGPARNRRLPGSSQVGCSERGPARTIVKSLVNRIGSIAMRATSPLRATIRQLTMDRHAVSSYQ